MYAPALRGPLSILPMSVNLTFQTSFFGPDSNQEYTQLSILAIVECLTRINVTWLDEHPNWPHLYKSGVRYKNDIPGTETFKDLPTLYRDKWGDCGTLGPARCAELRYAASKNGAYAGFRFRPYIRWRKRDGIWRYHVIVQWTLPNGRKIFEDPSLKLGMGQ